MKKLLERLTDSGYYLTDGHFRLISRMHSDTYVQARLSLMDPKFCKSFLSIAADRIEGINFTAVAGFTIGGLLFAQAISKRFQKPLLIGRKTPGSIEWINKDVIKSNTQLLVVDDVLTTESQLQLAILSLEKTNLNKISGILVAVNRSTKPPKLMFNGERPPIMPCAEIPAVLSDPSECPSCRAGIPPIDLSNPEENVIPVLLSQPREKSDFILKGYEKVYHMQKATERIEDLKAYKPWLPVLLAGLPMARMEEDVRLIHFVSHLTSVAREYAINPRVLSEIVGQLVSLSSIRVESRPVGCSLLIGNTEEIESLLELRARVRLSDEISHEKLTNLVPHFDALIETNYVLILRQDGTVQDFRRLTYSRTKPYREGIELLKYVTAMASSIGFVLKRGRNSISVYTKGRLDAVGELSERTGLWEFSIPLEGLREMYNIPSDIEALLIPLIEVARELVAKRYGALFVVGNSTGLKHTAPKIELIPQKLVAISIDDIVELAKLDGAMIIDRRGQLVQATVIIQNTEGDDSAVSGATHGGSRKETARRTSIECPECAVMYVSQNGTIEVYFRGSSCPIGEAVSGLRP